MEKILTVSIAAYNVAEYIRHTLDSIISKGCIDALQILVVDDGGKDDTLKIVKEYEEKYPDSVFGVHKENGGYGSVLNTSIRLAKGKYFKQLDGDDWFVTENMDKFVELLRGIDADYVITPMRMFNEVDESIVLKDYFADVAEGKYLFDEMDFKQISPMHCSTFRTEVLQKNDIKITEHCFYTDVELVNRPVPYMETVYVWHEPVYVYRVGREGQSVSKTGVRKHYKEHEKVFWNLIGIYNALPEDKTSKRQFLRRRLVKETAAQMKYFCYLDAGKGPYGELKAFGARLEKECPEILTAAMGYARFVKLMVRSKYRLYHIASRLM
ncbi:MAG: glycosyltransferase family 2 protein [Oscillospiraceae bacterium]|nr:glycosyltransferase family 2 protein [Oscillospiraceae bacterium]